MNEEELVSYVVRYCKHELSEEEYRFLQRWLEEKQENRQTFREWVRTYRQGRKVGCWDGIQEEQAWEQISCRLSASPRKRRRLWKEWWKQVAILILLLGSGLLYYSLQQLQESRETALSQIVPGSRKAVLRLSDGREVTLEKETTCVLTEEDGTPGRGIFPGIVGRYTGVAECGNRTDLSHGFWQGREKIDAERGSLFRSSNRYSPSFYCREFLQSRRGVGYAL